jgi:hypothetical protein
MKKKRFAALLKTFTEIEHLKGRELSLDRRGGSHKQASAPVSYQLTHFYDFQDQASKSA